MIPFSLSLLIMNELITRDRLAIARTHLANERTFLAYIRTAIVLFASAVGIIKIDFFSQIEELGFFLGGLSPFFLLIGIIRFRYTNRKIKQMYEEHTQSSS